MKIIFTRPLSKFIIGNVFVDRQFHSSVTALKPMSEMTKTKLSKILLLLYLTIRMKSMKRVEFLRHLMNTSFLTVVQKCNTQRQRSYDEA